jgi:hypothetical protein
VNDFVPSLRPGSRWSIHPALLIALFVVEAAVFYMHVARDVAPYYPPRFDQLSYYLSTYDLLNAFHAKGFSAFIDELLQPGNPTGTTFVLQGALLSLIGGAGRTTFLSINLLYFLALQFVFFLVLRSRIGRADFAWTGLALLLSSGTVFYAAGGIYDYRIDFSAMCLYGIWTCLIVWSGAFRHTSRSVIVAVAGILLVYSRFFTIIYIGTVLGLLLAKSLYELLRSSNSASDSAGRRCKNIILSGAIVAVVCLPRLYLSRDAIYGYYMIGHVLGEEKYIRAHELGLYSVANHLLYYPASILGRHVGTLTLLVAAALVGWTWTRDRVTLSEMFARLRQYGHDFTALSLAVLVPVATLTANVSKSPVVGGIVTVPVLLAMVLFGAAIWPYGASRMLGRPRRPISVTTVLAIAVALPAFIISGLSSKDIAPRGDLDRITLLARSIATYAADNNLSRLAISTDRIDDYQNVGTPRLSSIETLHRNLDVNGLLGHGSHGIFATSRDDAMQLLTASDVIVLTDPVTDRAHPFPINTKIKEYWGELWSWTNQNRKLLYCTEIFGIPYRVFVRTLPKAHADATSDGRSCIESRHPSGYLPKPGPANITGRGLFSDMLMKIVNRPKKTTAELIELINQRQADWWPAQFELTIDRSAEHDWIAIVDPDTDDMDRQRGSNFASSIGQVVAELRLRNAWAGY